jgi:hypothetical protein
MNTYVYTMVNEVKVKLYEYKSRHSINLPSDFVRDSAFPFKPKEELVARIEGKKIIIERA